jgi:hypothetical protein
MIPYGIRVSTINENKKKIAFTMKGVAIHDRLIGRWTKVLYRLELGPVNGLLMEKRVSRRPEKQLLDDLLYIEGVISIELKKKSFIVEKDECVVWVKLLEETTRETLEFLHLKTFLKKGG